VQADRAIRRRRVTFLRTADDGVTQRLNPDTALVGRPAHELVHLRLSLALVDEVDTATVARVTLLANEQLGQRDDARLHACTNTRVRVDKRDGSRTIELKSENFKNSKHCATATSLKQSRFSNCILRKINGWNSLPNNGVTSPSKPF